MTFGGGGGLTVSHALAAGPAGDWYIGGSFENTVDFAPGPAVASLTGRGVDGFFARIPALGDLVWVKSFGGSWYDRVARMASTPDGAIYVFAEYSKTINVPVLPPV
mgnify:CR=1 FL=1